MEKIEIIGNIGRDAETKTDAQNNVRVSFTLAATRKHRDGTSETTWYNVSTARAALAQYLTKGTKVYVCGGYSLSAYLDKDNKPKASVTVFPDTIEFCSSRADQQQQQQTAQQPYDYNVSGPMPQQQTQVDNSLPF